MLKFMRQWPTSDLIYDVGEQLHDEFMVSVTSVKSYLTHYNVTFVNFGPVFSKNNNF